MAQEAATVQLSRFRINDGGLRVERLKEGPSTREEQAVLARRGQAAVIVESELIG